MALEFDFKLNPDKPLSKVCIEQHLTHFSQVYNVILKLPYGRNKDRSDYTLVIKEKKGTCSTKHAFLKQIALENNIQGLHLCLGIYNMSESNTKGVGDVLKLFKLDYLPEAHTYLKYKSIVYDVTRETTSSESFIDSLILEEYILPNQIGTYKIETHQAYLKKWIQENNIDFRFKDLWKIREQCIDALK